VCLPGYNICFSHLFQRHILNFLVLVICFQYAIFLFPGRRDLFLGQYSFVSLCKEDVFLGHNIFVLRVHEMCFSDAIFLSLEETRFVPLTNYSYFLSRRDVFIISKNSPSKRDVFHGLNISCSQRQDLFLRHNIFVP
jgi:hypothetical protein